MPIATPVTPLAQQRQFLTMLKVVLDRAYQDGVDQFYNWKVDGDTISGIFRDGTQGYKFSLSDKGLIYSPIGSGRKDSDIEGATLANSALRFDAGKKPKKCKGAGTYACGGACLPNAKVCRINGKSVVKPQEMKVLLENGTSLVNGNAPKIDPLKVELPKAKGSLKDAEVFKVFDKPIVDLTPKPPEGQPKAVKKELHQMTIRELRVEAQSRGVPGYSHVDKNTLHAMITSWDKEPEDQRRIIKTIEKKAKQNKADPFSEFKRFFGLRRVLGTGSTITAAVILQVGLFSYNKAKDRYRGGFGESAEAAKEAAKGGIDVAKVPASKPYITFAIDRMGDHNTGNLESELKKSDPFFKKHHIVTIGSNDFEAGTKIKPNPVIPPPLQESFQAYEATSKRLNQMIIRGRDPQAVALAAHVIAYRKVYPNKQINLVGDHDGGMVVNEAAEILMKHNKKLAQNLRIVNLGTPSFGLTKKVATDDDGSTGRTVTISAGNDPTNMFPKQGNIQINSIKSGNVKDYFANDAAKSAIKGTLGGNDIKNDPMTRFMNETWHPEHPANDPNFLSMPEDLQVAATNKYLIGRFHETEPTKTQAKKIVIMAGAVRGVKSFKVKHQNRVNAAARAAAKKASAAQAATPPATQATPTPTTPTPTTPAVTQATPTATKGKTKAAATTPAAKSTSTKKTKAAATTPAATATPAATTPAATTPTATSTKTTTTKQAARKATPPAGIKPAGEVSLPTVVPGSNQKRRIRPLGDDLDLTNRQQVAEWNRNNPRDQVELVIKPKTSAASRSASKSSDPIDVWNESNPEDQLNANGEPKKKRGRKPKTDSIDLDNCSPAYREAFLLSVRRFRRS